MIDILAVSFAGLLIALAAILSSRLWHRFNGRTNHNGILEKLVVKVLGGEVLLGVFAIVIALLTLREFFRSW
ncbi:MAG: hypothetical protein JNM90_22280 [Burkholderiales bacterium]|nr:hypothetical protein [Burkholderiales bacterium]